MTNDEVGVLDTSTLVLIDRLDPDALPAEPVITAVTLAELSVGPLIAKTDGERAARQIRLQEAEASFEPLPFDSQRPVRSVVSRPRCVAQVARRRLAPSTR